MKLKLLARISSLLVFMILSCVCYGQRALTLHLSDSNKTQLQNITCQLVELNKIVSFSNEGNITFSDLPTGNYTIIIEGNGIKPIIINTVIPQSYPIEVNVTTTELDIKEVIVYGNTNTIQDRNSRSVEIMNSETFKDKGFLTISEALSSLPGVFQLSTGPGISRPVIRGLSGNRVVTLMNGIKVENQQWDPEHALGLTQFGMDRIEIIKGPLGFIYGPEAIGGVINYIDEKPAISGKIEADAHSEFNSNTFGTLTEVGFKKSQKNQFVILRLGMNNQSDYYSGFTHRVANSRFREITAKAIWGINGKKTLTQISYQLNVGYYGIVEPFEEEIPGKGKEEEDHPMEFEQPYHTMLHQIFSIKQTYITKHGQLNTQISYQHDRREEFEPGDSQLNPFLGFNLQNLNGAFTYEHYLTKQNTIQAGVQLKGISNTHFGYSILIPDYLQTEMGLFILNRNSFFNDKLKVDFGLRADKVDLQTQQFGQFKDSADYMPSFNKLFENVSSSIGINYLISKHFTSYLNYGTGFRAPNTAELLSNGIRLETQRFEKGNINFTKEQNSQLEIGINIETSYFEFELSAYTNQMKGYIFPVLNISDTIKELPVANFEQKDAKINGIDAKCTIHPRSNKWIIYSAQFSLLDGILNDGSTIKSLPQMPPYRTTHEFTFYTGKLGSIDKTYFRVNAVYCLAQNKIYSKNAELKTPDYFLLNVSFGGNVNVYKQPLIISAGVKNLLNNEYLDHMSRLRIYGVYGMGLNAYLSITWKFTSQNK